MIKDVGNLHLGDTVCDWHDQKMWDPAWRSSLIEGWVLTQHVRAPIDIANTLVRKCFDYGKVYSNKMLVVLDFEKDRIVCAYSYDGVFSGFVVFEPQKKASASDVDSH